MQGIKKVSLSELNREVELIGEVTALDGAFSLSTPDYKIVFEGVGERTLSLRRLVQANPYLVSDLTSLDGKVAVEWHTAEHIEASLSEVIPDLEFFPNWIHRSFEARGYNQENVKELVARILKIAKPNKHGIATLRNSLRAVAELYGISNIDEIIKATATRANLERKTIYIYKTHTNIEQHYSMLSKTQHLASCMVKGFNELGDTHFVEVDKSKAELAGYTVRYGTGKDVMFMPNVASLNGQTDVALGLVSRLSPEELLGAEEYAFEGRMILWRSEFEDEEEWLFTKFYGREGLSTPICAVTPQTNTARGFIVRGYVATKLNDADENNIRTPRYILPYIDGDDNVLERKGDRQFDKLGRAYYEFEVVSGHRHSYDADDYATVGNRFYVCQQDWTARPFEWEGICAITGESITELSGWNVDGETVRYDLAQYGLTFEQLYSVRKLIRGLEADAVKLVKTLKTQLKTAHDQIANETVKLINVRADLAKAGLPWQVEWLHADVGKNAPALEEQIDDFNQWVERKSQYGGLFTRQAFQFCAVAYEFAYRQFIAENVKLEQDELAFVYLLDEVIEAISTQREKEKNGLFRDALGEITRGLELFTARVRSTAKRLLPLAYAHDPDTYFYRLDDVWEALTSIDEPTFDEPYQH